MALSSRNFSKYYDWSFEFVYQTGEGVISDIGSLRYLDLRVYEFSRVDEREDARYISVWVFSALTPGWSISH